VPRIRLFVASRAACLGVMAVAVFACTTAFAQTPGALSDIALPGGLPAALAELNDPLPGDRGQFLVEVIRRTYGTPIAVRTDPRGAAIRALLAHLERARHSNEPSTTIPLPLTPAIWVDAVFGGRTTPDALVQAILESRNASLFYYGLMALDVSTREWLASDRGLIADLSNRYAAPFAVAAAGFRTSAGRVVVPGGSRFEPAWEALVGRRVNAPAEFLRAVLTVDEGRIGYVLTALSELTPEQVAFALGADATGAPAALHRLSESFDRAAPAWKIVDRTLWRPRRDPALLLSDLALDDSGRPELPGSRGFWAAVFAGEGGSIDRRRGADLSDRVDVSWLCGEIFSAPPAEQRRRYETVLFASRLIKRITPADADDAFEAVRSALKYPALTAALERAHATDIHLYAAAARRAARIAAISNADRRMRSTSQFQGTLALLARMVARRSISVKTFEAAVAELSGLDPDRSGEYGGAIVNWFAKWIAAARADVPVDDALMQLLAGRVAGSTRSVDWEGTHYTVDLAAAEMVRLGRFLGSAPHSYVSAALAQRGVAADDAWSRSVTELAYAIAIGQPESAVVSVADLARRHDFESRAEPGHGSLAWTLPEADVTAHGYRIAGALLGLDVALSDFWLTRVSLKAPPRRPSISSEERNSFIATVPLVEAGSLTDADRDRIGATIRAGRARARALVPADAVAIADAVAMEPIRRTVLPWMVENDAPRVISFFSPLELLWLGLGNGRAGGSLDGWGVSALRRTGCLCLQVPDKRNRDMLTARVNTGIRASGFPDLGLRLAELLSDMGMPAELFAGVLGSATSDFVNGAVSRYEDDERGLVEFVLALEADRVEEYLAMLTTGGPLVPPRDSDRLPGVAPAGRQP
jgi:hypothetical protein